MTDALKKVYTPLMERYSTRCHSCGFDKQFFGTKDEALRSALLAGWEFRVVPLGRPVTAQDHARMLPERAYCPHCQLLVKP